MADFHASTKTVSRSSGRSAVAASAYRSGESLTDKRQGIEHDYERRSGVVSSHLLVPEATAKTDKDQRDEREEIWNAAELAEKRKDGRTAREWVIALPAELSTEQRQELAIEFGQALAKRHGVAVDVAIHLPDREGDQRNHHAHVLTTTRTVSRNRETGAFELGGKSTMELSDTDRRKQGLGSAAEEVTRVREIWAGMVNQALERAGERGRVDHRSLRAQREAAIKAGDSSRAVALDRAPQLHLGPVATEMERRGKESDRGDQNREIKASNEQAVRAAAAKAEREKAHARLAKALLGQGKPKTLDELQAMGFARIEAEFAAQGKPASHHFQEIREKADAWVIKNLNLIIAKVVKDQEAAKLATKTEAENLAMLARQAKLEAMPTAELRAEEQRLRPPTVEALMERNPAFQALAKQQAQAEKERATAAAEIAKHAPDVERWRQNHPIRGWLHDKGVMQHKDVARVEAWLVQQRALQKTAEAVKGTIEGELRQKSPTWREQALGEWNGLVVKHTEVALALGAREIRERAEREARLQAEEKAKIDVLRKPLQKVVTAELVAAVAEATARVGRPGIAPRENERALKALVSELQERPGGGRNEIPTPAQTAAGKDLVGKLTLEQMNQQSRQREREHGNDRSR